MKLGASDISTLKLGSGDVSKVMLGATEAWAGGLSNAEAQAVVDAMTTTPDSTRQGHINDVWTTLKANGADGVIDRLYLIGADSQASALDWMDPSNSAKELTLVNSPTFTADREWRGDGSSAYIDLNYNPSTEAGGNWSLNEAMMGVWVRTRSTGNDQYIGTLPSFDNRTHIRERNNTQFGGYGPNSNNVIEDNASGTGLILLERSDATSVELFWNDSSLHADTSNAHSVPNADVYALAYRYFSSASGRSDGGISAIIVGGAPTTAQRTDIYNAINTYLTAIGAA